MITSFLALGLLGGLGNQAGEPSALVVHLDQAAAPISPSLYGIFFEEINQAGDGGLYGEMLSNRGLERHEGAIPGWRPFPDPASGAPALGPSVSVVDDGPNAAHAHSIAIAPGESVQNVGFGGLSIEKGTRYRVVVWAKGSGAIDVGFGDRPVRLGRAGGAWRRFEKTIRADGTAPRVPFVISAVGGGLNVAYASLMPERLWKDRRNGMRPDLATKVDAMHPAFVRFPGGCYVEGGDRFTDAFDWRASLGPVDERKGLAHSMWGYPNTFGLGYHEYLQWCEDLGAAPLFVVNCGIDHRQVWPMDDMDRWTQSALDAIEYANGPVSSKWGAARAKAGHPAPFGLRYVEIGNENGGGFYGGNAAYEPRYRLIHDAIKAKYPDVVTISNTPLPAQPVETVDEHYYSSPEWFWRNMDRYDAYDRKGPRIYVGEYAVTEGCGTGNLAAALGEAAFMAGMERNADVVTMASYAPLFKNVANAQWNPDAIVFDAARSYGTPSYHVQSMFSNNRPTRNVKVEFPALTSAPVPSSGRFGVETWSTQAEFRDIQVVADGKPLLPEAGLGARDVTAVRGAWVVTDGGLRQDSLDTDRVALLNGVDTAGARKVVVSMKARKLSGKEGFIVVMDERDGRALTWNVGGWGNRETAFQRNGAVMGKALPLAVETGQWYDLRVERDGNATRAYLDGKLVQELVEQGHPDFTAVAGIDDGAKELVLKVVNGSDEARTTRLDLLGAAVADAGRALTMTGPSLDAENSFDAPRAIAPAATTISGVASGMRYTFAPRSVTVLRFPIR